MLTPSRPRALHPFGGDDDPGAAVLDLAGSPPGRGVRVQRQVAGAGPPGGEERHDQVDARRQPHADEAAVPVQIRGEPAGPGVELRIGHRGVTVHDRGGGRVEVDEVQHGAGPDRCSAPPGALFGLAQAGVQRGQPRVGVLGGEAEQLAEAPHERGDARRVEQVAARVRDHLQLPAAGEALEGQVELHRPVTRVVVPGGDPGQREPVLLGTAVDDEHGVEQRGAGRVAAHVEAGDEVLERHVPVLVRRQGGRLHPAQQLPEGRIAGEAPRSTTVSRKYPMSGSTSVRSRPLTGVPTLMSSWPVARPSRAR